MNGDLSLDVFSCQLRRLGSKALTEKCCTPTCWLGGLLLHGNVIDLWWLPGVYLKDMKANCSLTGKWCYDSVRTGRVSGALHTMYCPALNLQIQVFKSCLLQVGFTFNKWSQFIKESAHSSNLGFSRSLLVLILVCFLLSPFPRFQL